MHVPCSFDPDGAPPPLRLAFLLRPRDAGGDLERLRAFSPVETALVLACRVRPPVSADEAVARGAIPR